MVENLTDYQLYNFIHHSRSVHRKTGKIGINSYCRSLGEKRRLI